MAGRAKIQTLLQPSWHTFLAIFWDCLSAKHHSNDFSHYRSARLVIRGRLFAVILAVAAPLWIPVDIWLLPPDSVGPMVILRLSLGIALLCLAATSVPQTRTGGRIVVYGLALLTMLFYLITQLLLETTATSPQLIGYTALPLLLVIVLALFPLTLLESGTLLALIIASVLGIHAFLGTLSGLPVLGFVWVLTLLAGFTLITQALNLYLLMQIYKQATHDSLTGLLNRGALFRQFEQSGQYGEPVGKPLAVLLLDLDRFKQINDSYGHPAGDLVLQSMAAALSAAAQPDEIVGRFGGEEFMVVLPGSTLTHAMARAEAFRAAIEGTPIGIGERLLYITASIGVAVGDDSDSLSELIRRADEALYGAKEQGRNMVVTEAAAVAS